MDVGLVARADDRGIGTITWGFAEAVRPARTLVVREPGAEGKGFVPHLNRYPGAQVVTYDGIAGRLDEAPVRDFLAGLDVVYLVETPYDPRFFGWARDAGCATVLHVMPEFWRAHEDRPTVWWLPTGWRAGLLPAECRVVPVPVACPDTGFPTTNEGEKPEHPRLLHVAGHRAAADRNGTLVMLQAARHLQGPWQVTIRCQDPVTPRARGLAHGVTVDWRAGSLADRWELYADHDLLVLPRRYGGLCLPALEAAACGLGLVMTDCSPNGEYPARLVRAMQRGTINTPAGRIPLYACRGVDLARDLQQLGDDPGAVATLRDEARAWAAGHSWDALLPTIMDELTLATERGARS